MYTKRIRIRNDEKQWICPSCGEVFPDENVGVCVATVWQYKAICKAPKSYFRGYANSCEVEYPMGHKCKLGGVRCV